MQHPSTPGAAPSPQPIRTSGVSDEDLATALRTSEGKEDAHPVAALLARHRQSVFDYAALCVPTANGAAMLATAAFSQVLENLRRSSATAALRPYLLVTTRQISRTWATDPRIAALLAGLQNPDAPGLNRQLVSRAFRSMPRPAQVLLWHAEVEAEGISIPAGLLGVDPRAAAIQLEQARELFRTGCLRAHNELAPTQECRHYSRLLDISLRRGGMLIPDIQHHLSECQHCRFAAEQLRHSDGRRALLLAEGVLGFGARAYLDSRPGRHNARTQAQSAAARGAGKHSRNGRPRALPRIGLQGKRLGPVLTTAGAVTTGLIVVAVVAGLWSGDGDGDHAAPGVPSGAVSDTAPTAPPTPTAPGTQEPTNSSPPPAGSAALPSGPLATTLRNAATDLCLDIRDGKVKAGSEITMSPCSDGRTQQWVYEEDGLLRSAADQDLCLNSHEIDGVAVLSGCTARSAVNGADVRYDLTIQGSVVPRWNEGLALVPVSPDDGSAVVVKVRDESKAQKWLTDPAAVGDKPRTGTGAALPSTKEVNNAPKGEGEGACDSEPCPRGDSASPSSGERNGIPGPDAPETSDDPPPTYSVRRAEESTSGRGDDDRLVRAAARHLFEGFGRHGEGGEVREGRGGRAGQDGRDGRDRTDVRNERNERDGRRGATPPSRDADVRAASTSGRGPSDAG